MLSPHEYLLWIGCQLCRLLECDIHLRAPPGPSFSDSTMLPECTNTARSDVICRPDTYPMHLFITPAAFTLTSTRLFPDNARILPMQEKSLRNIVTDTNQQPDKHDVHFMRLNNHVQGPKVAPVGATVTILIGKSTSVGVIVNVYAREIVAPPAFGRKCMYTKKISRPVGADLHAWQGKRERTEGPGPTSWRAMVH